MGLAEMTRALEEGKPKDRGGPVWWALRAGCRGEAGRVVSHSVRRGQGTCGNPHLPGVELRGAEGRCPASRSCLLAKASQGDQCY